MCCYLTYSEKGMKYSPFLKPGMDKITRSCLFLVFPLIIPGELLELRYPKPPPSASWGTPRSQRSHQTPLGLAGSEIYGSTKRLGIFQELEFQLHTKGCTCVSYPTFLPDEDPWEWSSGSGFGNNHGEAKRR